MTAGRGFDSRHLHQRHIREFAISADKPGKITEIGGGLEKAKA
jgi:hypothetical protein